MLTALTQTSELENVWAPAGLEAHAQQHGQALVREVALLVQRPFGCGQHPAAVLTEE